MRHRQLCVLLVAGASGCVLLDLLIFVTPILRASGPCQPDNEGSWSIGLFTGASSPLNLTPIEQPAANPVLTCASVADVPSNFVADPFLILDSDASLLLFFETKSNPSMQGDIAVARSRDGGSSWEYLGIALDEPWHLSYPFVFQWQGRPYLLPEGYGSGALRLYEVDEAAGGFPLRWRLHSVLLPRPLIDTSLVEWGGWWWMFTSDMERPGATKNGELEVYHADSPLGPWQPHTLNPVMNGDAAAGARMGGRLVEHGGSLYRFGQNCGSTYGHQLVAYRIDELSPTALRQTRVPLHFHRPPPPARGAAWNSARHHHLDALQLGGSWIVVMDGDSQLSAPISRRIIRSALLLGLIWVAGLALWAWQLWTGRQRHHNYPSLGGSGGNGTGGMQPSLGGVLCSRAGCSQHGSRGGMASKGGGSSTGLLRAGSGNGTAKRQMMMLGSGRWLKVAAKQQLLLLWKQRCGLWPAQRVQGPARCDSAQATYTLSCCVVQL